MFSLLITIISIALVAILALATIYYGGSSFNQGAAKANADKLINQAQQVAGAAQLYKADHPDEGYPAVSTLVSSHYLSQDPTALLEPSSISLGQIAYAADALWQDYANPNGSGTYMVIGAADDLTCSEINSKTMSLKGIPSKMYVEAAVSMCYHSATMDKNIVVTSLNGKSVSLDTPLSTPVSDVGSGSAKDSDYTSWYKQPQTSSSNSNSTSGSNGTNSGSATSTVGTGLTVSGDLTTFSMVQPNSNYYTDIKLSNADPTYHYLISAATTGDSVFSISSFNCAGWQVPAQSDCTVTVRYTSGNFIRSYSGAIVLELADFSGASYTKTFSLAGSTTGTAQYCFNSTCASTIPEFLTAMSAYRETMYQSLLGSCDSTTSGGVTVPLYWKITESVSSMYPNGSLNIKEDKYCPAGIAYPSGQTKSPIYLDASYTLQP